MARIRSIHPGFFTDEAWVSVSAYARLFGIGLWTEADDQGVFEWKPVTLKMRIFPADNADVGTLLAELEAADLVCKYEIDGRNYGAIRNFRKFQKPKTPNSTHPTTDKIRIYVGLSAIISDKGDAEVASFPQNGETDEAEPASFPQNGEKPRLMEDGGGEEKKVYAFSGQVVRLNRADYDRWRKLYAETMPDFDAELSRCDDSLRGKPGDWFPACSAMLNAKHQKILADRKDRPTERKPKALVVGSPEWLAMEARGMA